MNLKNKINQQNKYLGFNLYSLCGWLTFIGLIYIIYSSQNTYENYTSAMGIIFFIKILLSSMFFYFIISLSGIIWAIEYITEKKIKNKFFTKNTPFKIFKYIGATLSTIYIISVVILFLYTLLH